MKRYIVCDDYSNYYEITDWGGLVNILIDNLHEDTLDNITVLPCNMFRTEKTLED